MNEPEHPEAFAWTDADASYRELLAPELRGAAGAPAHADLLAARALRLETAKIGGLSRPESEVSLAPLAHLPALREVERTRIYLRQADVDALGGLAGLEALACWPMATRSRSPSTSGPCARSRAHAGSRSSTCGSARSRRWPPSAASER